MKKSHPERMICRLRGSARYRNRRRSDNSRQTRMGEIMQVRALDSSRHVGDRANEAVSKFAPAMPRLPGVTAGLAYLAPTTERPYNYMYEPPAGTAQQNCEYRVRPVWIRDARAVSSPSIHLEGFELWDAPTAVTDFTDQDAIRSRYYAETAELAKYVTGADHAHIFDHQVRQREAGRPTLTFGRAGDGSRPSAAGRITTTPRVPGRSGSISCLLTRRSGQRRTALRLSTSGVPSAAKSWIRHWRCATHARSR
jgi:hypothetical protein